MLFSSLLGFLGGWRKLFLKKNFLYYFLQMIQISYFFYILLYSFKNIFILNLIWCVDLVILALVVLSVYVLVSFCCLLLKNTKILFLFFFWFIRYKIINNNKKLIIIIIYFLFVVLNNWLGWFSIEFYWLQFFVVAVVFVLLWLLSFVFVVVGIFYYNLFNFYFLSKTQIFHTFMQQSLYINLV